MLSFYMRIPLVFIFGLAIALWTVSTTAADPGPYPPAAGMPGSTAVHKDDSLFISWAIDYRDYIEGAELDEVWKTPEKALGPADGTIGGVVSLGKGGQITMLFDPPISNGPGYDFAVFENGFSDGFLELAFVEVSSDGENFRRFPNRSLTPGLVGPFDYSVDPTHINGLAGKYRVGYGTPFDLNDLPADPNLDLNAVRYVRIVDIIGDGKTLDSHGNPIYDPWPTMGSAGFDLDAIGAINIKLPDQPKLKNAYVAAEKLVMNFSYAENEQFEAVIWISSDLKHWQVLDTGQPQYSIEVRSENGITTLQARVLAAEKQFYRLSLELQ